MIKKFFAKNHTPIVPEIITHYALRITHCFFVAMIFTLLLAFTQTASAYDYIRFCGHVAGYGWQEPVGNGGVIGTTGESRALEAVVISFDGDIRYRAHVQNTGWQNWVYEGEVAGTTGRDLHMEAIRIELGGRAAERYDIYYRAHVENYGWRDWVKNGEIAGSIGENLRLEALQIQLVEKGSHPHRDRHDRRPRYDW